MDKDTRSQIQRATQSARSLLEREYAEQLEGTFDIRPDGTIAAAPGDHLDAEQRLIRQKLVAAINHHRPHAANNAEAVDAYLREAAFTMLNRFVALKMLEARDLVQQCISQGEQSSGFKEFTGLAPGLVQLPDKGYRLYIECLFDEIAREVQVLFERRDPASLLWTRRQALTDLLAILNTSELAGVWGEDETIGWVYQYFNSDEERKQMRAESQAPRNSRELAVRNQFFTPRYVVEFLTDNTLGRIWYEMQQGNTRLVEECDYLVRRPSEVFLRQGEAAAAEEDADADLSQEELLKKTVYIPLRAKKDPRDLKILDPACGSGHFLLYTFDLLLTIYEEGWADGEAPVSEVTGQSLRQDYSTLEELRAAVPGLILRYNLHGIDIDPRAAQIASLALWMRAQRAYNDFRIARRQRQPIRKTNVVVAEPMPGEGQMVEEFAQTLEPAVLGNLFRRIVKEMELAGEAGSLLKIEESIADAVTEARQQYQRWQQELSRGYLPGFEPRAMQGTLDLSGIDDESFFNEMEERMIDALRGYAEKSQNGQTYQRRLFAEDAARGFGFIDACRRRYDVVIMNPPFGERPKGCDEWLRFSYPLTANDLYSMFFERTLQLLTEIGKVGVISNRTWLGLPTFEKLRSEVLGILGSLDIVADLGSFVLEAQVETASIVIGASTDKVFVAPWVRLLKTKAKEKLLRDALTSLANGERHKMLYLSAQERYDTLPSNVFGYWMSNTLAATYSLSNSIGVKAAIVKQGTATADDFRFLRLAWEVEPTRIGLNRQWVRFAKGGEYSPFYDDVHLVMRWESNGHEIAAFPKAYIRNASYYGLSGITWPRRTTSPFGVRVLPSGCAFGDKGPSALPERESPGVLLGLLVTRPSRLLLSVRLGAGDDAPGSAAKSYEVGLVKDLPFPKLSDSDRSQIESLTNKAVSLVLRKFQLQDETAALFIAPEGILTANKLNLKSLDQCISTSLEEREECLREVSEYQQLLDEIVAQSFGFSTDDHSVMLEELEAPINSLPGSHPVDEELFRKAYLTKNSIPGEVLPGGLDAEEDVRVQTRRKQQHSSLRDEETICRLFEIPPEKFIELRRRLQLQRQEDLETMAKQIASYGVGVAFGRFDVRRVLDANIAAPDPFAELPATSPGMFPILSDAEKPVPEDYPCIVSDTGIFVDDLGHTDDLLKYVQQVFDVVWQQQGRDLESQLCKVLQPGALDIRDWLRKSFFDEHIKRYSKSRRKAPVYWQLATPTASYSVWLYYHHFTRDSFYTILNDYVKPKLDHEERKLTGLTQEAGPNPSASQRKEIAAQEAFVAELRAFRDEVAIIAPLWNPNLNDGVIINFAPLWRLVPHHRSWQKECKDCWEQLVKGDYDWAHLAMHLWPERVVPKCQTDRSLAIAHGLEEVFWEADDATGKWKPRPISKAAITQLIQERTSPAVKDALQRLLDAPAASGSTQSRSRRKKS